MFRFGEGSFVSLSEESTSASLFQTVPGTLRVKTLLLKLGCAVVRRELHARRCYMYYRILDILETVSEKLSSCQCIPMRWR